MIASIKYMQENYYSYH